LNVGSSQNTTVIHNTGQSTPDTGKENVRIIGNHTSNSLNMLSGIAGIGTNGVTDTATILDLRVSGGRLNVGSVSPSPTPPCLAVPR